jgi:heat shock protein HslJ
VRFLAIARNDKNGAIFDDKKTKLKITYTQHTVFYSKKQFSFVTCSTYFLHLPYMDTNRIEPSNWVLKDYIKQPLKAAYKYVLTLEITQSSNILYGLYGASFVNRYHSIVCVRKNNHNIIVNNPPVSGISMSGSPEKMEAERIFINNLSHTNYWELKDGELLLYVQKNGDDYQEIMVFTQATMIEDRHIDHPNWVLRDYQQVPLEAKYKNLVSLHITRQSSTVYAISGENFVNTYRGKIYISDKNYNIITHEINISMTKMGGAPEMSKAENVFFRNLRGVNYWEEKEGDLLLYVAKTDNTYQELMIFTKT